MRKQEKLSTDHSCRTSMVTKSYFDTLVSCNRILLALHHFLGVCPAEEQVKQFWIWLSKISTVTRMFLLQITCSFVMKEASFSFDLFVCSRTSLALFLVAVTLLPGAMLPGEMSELITPIIEFPFLVKVLEVL